MKQRIPMMLAYDSTATRSARPPLAEVRFRISMAWQVIRHGEEVLR